MVLSVRIRKESVGAKSEKVDELALLAIILLLSDVFDCPEEAHLNRWAKRRLIILKIDVS